MRESERSERGVGLVVRAIEILCLLALPLGFLAAGGHYVHEQQRKLETYVEVEALVLARRVRQRFSGPEQAVRTYLPLVRYRYVVDGRSYTSENVTPLGVSASRSWARGVLCEYPPGKTVSAWYDPDDPSEAFLLRHASFAFYLFLLIPVALVGLVVRSRAAIVTCWHLVGALVFVHFSSLGGDLSLGSLGSTSLLVYEALGVVPILRFLRSVPVDAEAAE